MVDPAFKTYRCSRPGCQAGATVTPALVVKPNPIYVGSYKGTRYVLWLPLCDRHFNALSIEEIVGGQAIAGLQAEVNKDFAKNLAPADWKSANMEPVKHRTNEWISAATGYENQMRIGMQ